VGFVRDLPHELVAAFRATLSEAREADFLLHVVDAADPHREERIGQVDEVLAEIGAGDIPQLLVFNKIDRLEDATPRHDQARGRERLWLSARSGAGLEALRAALATRFGDRLLGGEVELEAGEGRLHARLHALGAVRAESPGEQGGWRLRLELPRAVAERMAGEPGGESLRPLLLVAPGAPTYNP
jgi:GTP-binding protein HflX